MDYVITEFGAVGDGITECTGAIQRAIDSCAALGGGRVVIPLGGFVTGTLFLHSNMELHFEPGSVLVAASEYSRFPEIRSQTWNTDYAPRKNSRCLLYAESVHHFSVTGLGTIECHGADWCEPDSNEGAVNLWKRSTSEVIPRVLLLVDCSDFVLSDFCIHDSPAGWAAWLLDCRNGSIHALSILSDKRMPNADGLHINACRDITVSDCRISTGDDALILRDYVSPLKRPVPCERIMVTNCILSSHSSGIRVGWANDWIIRDCMISNCLITESTNGIVIQLPTFPERVADQGVEKTVITGLSFKHIRLRSIFFEPIHITLMEGCGAQEVSRLTFSDIDSESRLPIRINGLEETPVKDVSIVHSAFRLIHKLTVDVPVPRHYWNQKAYADRPSVEHAERLQIAQVTFDY